MIYIIFVNWDMPGTGGSIGPFEDEAQAEAWLEEWRDSFFECQPIILEPITSDEWEQQENEAYEEYVREHELAA